MIHTLSEAVKITLAKAATAAGSSAANSDAVDMDGYDGVAFLTTFGTITSGAVTSIKVQGSVTSNFAEPIDLQGTNITVADDDDGQSFLVDVTRPPYRYLRLVVSRATQNAVIGEIYAIRYRSRGPLPEVNAVNDVMTVAVHPDPVAGTP